jgi:hypothetical protein
MPVETVERVQAREGRLSKRLGETGSSLDRAAKRRLERRQRRAQRKRRRLSGAGVKSKEPAPAAS